MLELKEGLHVYVVEVGRRDGWGELAPPTEEEALQHLESLCQSIEQQGGELMGIMPQTVKVECPSGTEGLCTEERIFLIVRK